MDGYQFEASYQCELKHAGLKVLFVDDNGHAGGYAADLVLNQNPQATGSMYEQREPYTRLLLGTRYCMLRREFNSWRGWNREIPAVGRDPCVKLAKRQVRAVAAEELRGWHGRQAAGLVGIAKDELARFDRTLVRI